MTRIHTPTPRLRDSAYHAQRTAAGLSTPPRFDRPRLSPAARFLLTLLAIAAALIFWGTR